MPDRVVGVLHTQRPEGRSRTGNPRRVRGHQVGGQRDQGRPVCCDVVDDQQHHMVVGGDLEQHRPQRRRRGDVESLGGEFDAHLEQFVLGTHRAGDQLRHSLRDGKDLLIRALHRVGVDRTQDLLALDHVHQGGGQRALVERAPQPQTERDVVVGRIGVEPVDEPHPLLRKRQRDPVRPFLRGERSDRHAVEIGRGTDRFGEIRHHRRIEQDPYAQTHTQDLVDPGDGTGGGQRIAAEFEEGVVGADGVDPEDVCERSRHSVLHRSRWFTVFACGAAELGCRKGTFVKFSDRRQRDLVEDHDRRRHHELRQESPGVVGQVAGIDGAARGGFDVCRQSRVATRSVHTDRHGEVHCRMSGQYRVDLAQFDPEAADLDLLIGSSHVGDLEDGPAVGLGHLDPAHHVAGAVHPDALAGIGIGHEPMRGEVGSTAVGTRDTRSTDVQLPRHAGGDRT